MQMKKFDLMSASKDQIWRQPEKLEARKDLFQIFEIRSSVALYASRVFFFLVGYSKNINLLRINKHQ